MSRPSKHRAAIIAAASRLFRRQGYAGTGVNDIVALSGAPKGSLYHYFPKGKEQIAEEAVLFAGRLVAESRPGAEC
jgi:TetR/AcrR family transcriptional repressor of lmrAB and yxaGH operons